MPGPVSEIVDRLFARAAADTRAAPLADWFARAYRDGQWTAERLDAHVHSFVEVYSPDTGCALKVESDGAS